MLALLGHDVEHDLLDLLGVAAGAVGYICEGSRVDVESLDVDENLVVIDFVHVVVQLVCGLREDSLGFDYSVNSVFISVFLCHSFLILR